MTDKVLIKAKCLKDLLSLFDEGQRLDDLALGDAWHPSSGFVNENHYCPVKKVKKQA